MVEVKCEARVREEEIPTFTPAFLAMVKRVDKERKPDSYWEWLAEPVDGGVAVRLRGVQRCHEFFPSELLERSQYDEGKKAYFAKK